MRPAVFPGRRPTPQASQQLSGRVILVTGVTAGIGRAIVRRLSAAGAIVIGCARDEQRLAAVRTELPPVDVRRADVRSDADRAALVGYVLDRYGRIDALVNNAGVGHVGLVEDIRADQVERIYQTNVVGLVDLTRRVLPHLLARGDGDVVMVSSASSWLATPPLTVYCSSKFAVHGFVEGLRREVGPRGVRISSVNPGPVATEWLARCLDHQPAEGEPGLRLSPGVDADRVAAAVQRALTSGRGTTIAVPRFYGLGRLLSVQPFKLTTDTLLGVAARRAAAIGDRMARARTPGVPAESTGTVPPERRDSG